MSRQLTKKQRKVHEIDKGSKMHRIAFLEHGCPTVYIARCESFYKIGITRSSIQNRLEGMRTGNPFPIVPVYAIRTLRYKELEEALHVHFAHRQHFREWYALTLDDEAEIDKFVVDFLHGKET